MAKGFILKQPDFKAVHSVASLFIVVTKTSDYALGGVLSQVDTTGSERPIYFNSRKFTTAKANYTITEKEGLAIVSCVQILVLYLR